MELSQAEYDALPEDLKPIVDCRLPGAARLSDLVTDLFEETERLKLAQSLSIDERFGSALFDQVCEWLGENTEPEMVYSFEALVDWADRNGFVPAADTPESGPGRKL